MPNYIKRTLKTVQKAQAQRDATYVAPTPRIHPGNLGSQEELDNNAAWEKIKAETAKKKAARDSAFNAAAVRGDLKRIKAGLKKYPNK